MAKDLNDQQTPCLRVEPAVLPRDRRDEMLDLYREVLARVVLADDPRHTLVALRTWLDRDKLGRLAADLPPRAGAVLLAGPAT
jgi:hypothetical protein